MSNAVKRLRTLARRVRRTARGTFSAQAADPVSPWARPLPASRRHACPICRWSGAAFTGGFHAESAACPQCGSISRDRFPFHCLVHRSPEMLGARPPGTSPRMDGAYRKAMGRWFDQLCSDYNESAHRGTVRLDLQAIARPDASFDLVLTPHVLEHVPDTDAALAELFRVVAPGGRVYLQVPVLQGRTAPPLSPEFHGDNTPVFWRFGFDLTAHLRAHGFITSLLCAREWSDAVAAGRTHWPADTSPEFDVTSMLAGAVRNDLVVVAEAADADRFGFLRAYMFLTWECLRP